MKDEERELLKALVELHSALDECSCFIEQMQDKIQNVIDLLTKK